jgi:TonB family protein
MNSVNVRRFREWPGLRCLAVLITSLLLTGLLGAIPAPEERKLVHRVEPVYPEIAKKNSITGTVKLRLTIARDGTVKGAEPIGGHPVLVEALLNAVENWKYAAAAKESTVTIEFKFDGAK